MTAKREPRSITLAEIEQRFLLDGASYWFGETWCPAVHHRKEGGYGIRVVATASQSGPNAYVGFDYFYLDTDGLITTAPRGFARDYKPGRVVDIAAAVERFAVPRQGARRIA
jgi:hypothetical protein